MRIAIDGMLLGRRFSGVEGSIANLARALALSGRHDYVLFAAPCCPSFVATSVPVLGADVSSACHCGSPEVPGEPHYRTAKPNSLFCNLRCVTTRWPVRFRPVRILWEQCVLPPLLKRGRHDLIHAPGYIAPLLSPVPVVLTLYDLLALTHPEFCTAANRLHYRMLLAPSVRKAARILVPSETTRRDLLRCFPAAAGKARVVPLGIGDEFRPVQDEEAFTRLRRKYGLAGRFILFVGGIEPKKNLPRLVEAYRLLRHRMAISPQLVIAGTPSWDRDRVRRTIHAQHIEDSVSLTGFVPPEDLPLLYAMADLFVFPSLYEGFGLPPLEAMACGTPVVVSDRGALPETAGRAALVVDALSPRKIADAMAAVLGDPALQADLRHKGLAHARQFTWAAAAAATEAVYAEAAAP